jgi:hypothetical protein
LDFNKYQHIERFGNSEVDGINIGECYIFYKIDGTNASLWFNSGCLYAGSRNRQLTFEKDNAGFFNWAYEQENITDFFKEFPHLRLCGEWLVKHSINTYRNNAWRKFYVFDVQDIFGNYLHYNMYKPILEKYNIDYIPPLAIINNPSYESLIKLLDSTGQFLIKDGCGNGEGIVIKNYDFVNKFGRTIWAKIICNEFKEKQHKEMGTPIIKNIEIIEQKIIDDLLTEEFVEKEYYKILCETDHKQWSSKFIPKLLNKVFYEFIKDEHWNIIKKYKYPKIDFKRLNQLCILKIKQIKGELF